MSDLTELLRGRIGLNGGGDPLCQRAADEIDRLRAALEAIAAGNVERIGEEGVCAPYIRLAREALSDDHPPLPPIPDEAPPGLGMEMF